MVRFSGRMDGTVARKVCTSSKGGHCFWRLSSSRYERVGRLRRTVTIVVQGSWHPTSVSFPESDRDTMPPT